MNGRNEPRKTEVRLYNVAPGEQAWIYEMGIPVVELSDDKWHINVMQKMPVGRDRDNVNPSYSLEMFESPSSTSSTRSCRLKMRRC
jgi:hypothetical protein